MWENPARHPAGGLPHRAHRSEAQKNRATPRHAGKKYGEPASAPVDAATKAKEPRRPDDSLEKLREPGPATAGGKGECLAPTPARRENEGGNNPERRGRRGNGTPTPGGRLPYLVTGNTPKAGHADYRPGAQGKGGLGKRRPKGQSRLALTPSHTQRTTAGRNPPVPSLNANHAKGRDHATPQRRASHPNPHTTRELQTETPLNEARILCPPNSVSARCG